MTLKNISRKNRNPVPNGIIYLKGGDLDEEIKIYRERVRIWNIKDFFSEPFFETKKVVYLPVYADYAGSS
ncbi:MAG: hypothetical protein BWX96_02061 [Bacteroidetes bacterium ADurb.Bin145]|nr:MAG: hypothetical protein BWX96_02061 [Bacteroidetes bacterium ADurb.Bin145]